MSYGTIRPYEISLWTLQDSFITVLKPIYGNFKGQLITPKLSLKNNALTLNFSIPAKYRNESGESVDNPLWYNVSNGNLIVNLRKIKVIINKGEEGEEVFEFIIHKAEDSHKGGILACDVEAEWLAFEELGKNGYKLCLNYDEFLIDLEKQEAENASSEKPDEIKFLPTLNYWADKIFANTNWDYSIQMDWTSYDGIIDLDADGKIYQYDKATNEDRKELNATREARGLRRRDKIYEEEYNSSWSINESTDKLEPKDTVQFQEKSRIPEIEKSNIFNITQELAELFGVFVRYKYYYDENYHIIKRECIFYNNFLDELNNKFDINYGYQTSEITRLIESADVITKLYIPTTEDNSIIDVDANRSKEDYILNFDYLYMAGAITDEQYNSIPDYERKIYELNTNYKNSSDKANELNVEIVKLKAEKTVLENSIIYDKEQLSDADKLLQSITNNSGILKKTKNNPELLMLLPSGENNTFKVTLSLEGIHPDTIHLYANFSENKVSDEIQNFTIVYDEITGNNVVGLKDIYAAKGGRAYLTCEYTPRLKYDNIKESFSIKLKNDEEKLINVSNDLEDKENELKELENIIKESQENLIITRAEFERMMGPALREGSWEAEDSYLNYGDKHFIKDLFFPTVREDVRTFWDAELFDGEQNNFYEIGLNQTKEYYQIFEITYDIYSKLKDNLEGYTLYFETPFENSNMPPKKHFLGYGSSYNFFFLTQIENEEVKPFIMITDTDKNYEEGKSINFALGITEINDENELILKDENKIVISPTISRENYKMVYPRIEINYSDVGEYKEELILIQEEGDVKLSEYTDFSVLVRENEKIYLTIKPTVFLKGNILYNNQIFLKQNEFSLEFVTKNENENLHLYLDGLEVSKTNAFPKVSYTVKVSSVDKSFMQKSYQKLNCIANINDTDLKLKNVQGYISEIELDLDQPWQDTFTVQNYKNKFEDLFSRIVASTEAMRQNQVSYDRASGAFGADGTLNGNILQNTLNSVDLNYAFNNGNLLIDENKGIWACSEEGVVAIRGGGIFCATQKDTYDNWIWNTGVTPSGISASLIKAGVIDTNLIRIYSGDNLRFQMNADGLFAYAKTTAGEANYDKYVVHNSEGLFLTEKIEKTIDEETISNLVNLVEISWDGLILRNKDGVPVFQANDNGDLEITGILTAKTGNIGNWTINDYGLISEDGSSFLYASPSINDTTELIFKAGDHFSVSKDGTLTATNAIVGGTLTAETVISTSGGNLGVLDAVQKLTVVSVGAGNTFKRYNSNYDGNIVEDPNSLRFQIIANNFEIEKDNNDNPKITFWDGDTQIQIGENIRWENEKLMTFIVSIDFMSLSDKKDITIKAIEASSSPIKEFDTILSLTLEETNVNKRISEIEPLSYNFILNEDEAAKTNTFSIEIENFSEEELAKAKWYLNGEEKSYGENNPLAITISSNDIINTAILQFELNGVTREAYITKTIVPKNITTLVIESSQGTIFKNGNIETILTAQLYEGNNIINSKDDNITDENTIYGYVWKEIENTKETIVKVNSKKISINNESFTEKATYICEIYESAQEAKNAASA